MYKCVCVCVCVCAFICVCMSRCSRPHLPLYIYLYAEAYIEVVTVEFRRQPGGHLQQTVKHHQCIEVEAIVHQTIHSEPGYIYIRISDVGFDHPEWLESASDRSADSNPGLPTWCQTLNLYVYIYVCIYVYTGIHVNACIGTHI